MEEVPRASHPVRPPPLRNKSKLPVRLSHEGDALAKLVMSVEKERQDVTAGNRASRVLRPIAVSCSFTVDEPGMSLSKRRMHLQSDTASPHGRLALH